ncbi:hypothetical protein ASE11_09035 [Hydrogenophaga sp. Root209]|nr:hypothetical protein ASE11_09035 [Hydrogenophaga sp. Root209]
MLRCCPLYWVLAERSELPTFNFTPSLSLRALIIEGQPWFVVKDGLRTTFLIIRVILLRLNYVGERLCG